MKKLAVLLVLLLVAFAIWLARNWRLPATPSIPALFKSSLPAACRQVVLVLSPSQPSVTARLWLLERSTSDDAWHTATDPIPVTLGHKGLAWGVGEHTGAAPAGFPLKREGDKCSPAGVFRLPFAFGLAAAVDAPWLKLPYTPLTPSIVGVDDPKSRYYNQVVDNTVVTPDWESNEAMQRHGELYRWGAFIAHNPDATPGLGSCIFLHLWPGPGKATSGCTAMSREDIEKVLRWLDAAKEPHLVQGLEGW
ncbi:MAG: L,D-transpeptidase family protein [Prosthecobacter sp.]|nr:L,D-transpeptidase family protein [Prosthecobacter sp.]